MYANHSGWNIEHGAFSYDVYLDENKTDHAIHYKDGFVAKQCSPFENVTHDWNNDGDVYTLYGAWFECRYGNEFIPAHVLVQFAIDAIEEELSNVKSVDGITVPARDKRPSLSDMIEKTEKRSMHQEIEKNQKMAMLGIQRPEDKVR